MSSSFLTAVAPCSHLGTNEQGIAVVLATAVVWGDGLRVLLVADTSKATGCDAAFRRDYAQWEATGGRGAPPEHPAEELLQPIALSSECIAGGDLLRRGSTSTGGTGSEREATVSFEGPIGHADTAISFTVKHPSFGAQTVNIDLKRAASAA